MKETILVITLLSAVLWSIPAWACTVTLTGKKASLDGSVMVSHSDDGLKDAGLIYVSPKDHKPGALRPVYYAHYSLDFKPPWGATLSHRIVFKDRVSAYTYVNQSRKGLPDPIGGLTWYGPDRPASAVLMPFYAGATGLPKCMQTEDILAFDRGSMWTAFNYVSNYAQLKYSYMIKDIAAQRDHFESLAFGKQKGLEAQALKLWQAGNQAGARKLLTDYSNKNAEAVLAAWRKLSEDLYIKCNDGYINTREEIAHPVFYPSWWLKLVGFEKGPTSYEKPAAQ
jgi:dipeptidase